MRWALRPAWTTFAALAGAFLTSAALAALFLTFELAWEAQGAAKDSGHAYVFRLPQSINAAADEPGDGFRSELLVFENGVRLGPPHTLHDEIREHGKGRYSHWGQNLYLSATDNSDPRANGRSYSILARVSVPDWIAVPALVAGMLMLVLAADAHAGRAASTALARRISRWGAARGIDRGVSASFLLLLGGMLLILAGPLLLLPVEPITTTPDAPPGYSLATLPGISGWDDPAVRRRPGEADAAFVERMTLIVSQSIYHCDLNSTPRGIDWIMSKVDPFAFGDVGILTPAALRCGWCNQVSYVLARLLRDGGVDADLLVLNGHVVTLAKYDGKQWIADADFGVGPHEYPLAFRDVERAYRRITGDDDGWLSQLAAAYETTRDDSPYFRSMQWLDDTEWRQRTILAVLEIVAWALVPVGIVMVGVGHRVRRASRRPARTAPAA